MYHGSKSLDKSTASVECVLRARDEAAYFLNPVPLQEMYERWIAKFEKPRLKALGGLKRRLEKSNGHHLPPGSRPSRHGAW